MPPKTRGRKARSVSPTPVAAKEPAKKLTKRVTKKKPEEASRLEEVGSTSDLAASHALLQAEMAELKIKLAEALTLKEQPSTAVTKEPAAAAAAEPIVITIPSDPEPRQWAGESSKL